jgi:ech hydrogenase subunit F
MNILTLISRNWVRAPQTRRFPDRQPPAPAYRGRVVLEPAMCRSCSKCAQVCVSAAITVEHVEGDRYEWSYDPARCTYCGVCVAYCPVTCLLQLDDRSPTCSRPDAQAEIVTVIKKPKNKKKRLARPAPAAPPPTEAAPAPATAEPAAPPTAATQASGAPAEDRAGVAGEEGPR